ncbi:restriction endonuclease subunit S [Escherichia coli]
MMKISEMPKYEVYKDSGVEWIGKIPEHWNLKSLKRVVKEHSGNGFPIELQGQAGDIPFLKVSDLSCEGILVDKSSNRVSHKVVQKQKWNIVPAGSLVTAKIGEALRKNHRKLLAYDSIIDNNCIAFECVKIEKKYNFYLHLVIDFDWFVNPGAVPSISVSKYKSQKVVVPSMKEQVLIANFLDKKIALIDEAISIKEKQISLLKERKQIIIQQAVTQGLDPNVPMKDSGVDWIGDIPAHWGCTAVKRLLDIPITDGPHTTPQLHDEGIPFISAEAIKGGEINFDKKRGYINEKDYLLFSNKYTPKVNDIYMVKSGATTGRVAIVRTEMKFTIWSPLAVFRVDKNKLNPLYLYYFLQSYSFLKGVELSWSFGTQQNIGMGVLGNLFALAPPLEEQQLIVNSIEPHFREIDIASEQVYQQIEKLKEYKTTLINSAVTGKIKITPEMVEQ